MKEIQRVREIKRDISQTNRTRNAEAVNKDMRSHLSSNPPYKKNTEKK